jgi:hypothetical protein
VAVRRRSDRALKKKKKKKREEKRASESRALDEQANKVEKKNVFFAAPTVTLFLHSFLPVLLRCTS